MTEEISIVLDFDHNDIDPETLETLTQTLYKRLYDLAEVDTIKRIYPAGEQLDTNLKGGQQIPLSGKLALVFKKIKSSRVLRTILQRLLNKSVKIKFKNGKKELLLDSSNFSEKEVIKIINTLKDF